MKTVKTAQDMMRRLEELYDQVQNGAIEVDQGKALLDIRKTQLRLAELNARFNLRNGQKPVALLGEANEDGNAPEANPKVEEKG